MEHELSKELIAILNKFQPEYFKRFYNFLMSPYCYQDIELKQSLSQLRGLLDFIIEAKEKSETLTRRKAKDCLAKLSKSETADAEEKRLDRVMSELLKMVKQFLYWETIQKHEKNAFSEKLMLSKFYFDHKLDDLYIETFFDAEHLLAKQFPQKDSAYFYNKFLLEYIRADFLSLKDNQKGELNFHNIISNLDYFYASHVMELLCHIKNRKEVVLSNEGSLDTYNSFQTRLLDLIYDKTLASPLLEAYDQILRLLSIDTLDKDKVYKLETYLEANGATIPFTKLLDMQAYVRNLWGNRYHADKNIDTLTDLFEAYKRHWNDGKKGNLWQKQGQILPNVLINSVTTAMKLHVKTNEPISTYSQWVDTLLTNLSTDKIYNKDGLQQEILDLCRANYFLRLKGYKEAEKYAHALYEKYKNPYLASKARLILIEICYLNQPEKYDETLQNFRTWLTENKDIPKLRKEGIRKELSEVLKDLKVANKQKKSKKLKVSKEVKIVNPKKIKIVEAIKK
jgi:hypothetical protein